jgi:hypothetical protein
MKTSPKDFFFHLGVIVALYIGAISLIQLAFRIIDVLHPNIVTGVYYGSTSISWPVATLIIIFPIFILLSWFLNKDYRMYPEKKNLGIRRWLVYITLFVAGVVIAGDLIALLYTFLNGEEITTGFTLKVLAVFLVAGSIFGYYISDLRGKASSKTNKLSAWASGIIILLLVIVGFSIIGSPHTQRLRRIDSQRVSDLQGIQWQIVNYWQQKQKLPDSLDQLNDSISGFRVPTDPQTGKPYTYIKRKTTTAEPPTFDLCSDFNLPSANGSKPYPIGRTENDNWEHLKGATCFGRNIDPQLYPPRKLPM